MLSNKDADICRFRENRDMKIKRHSVTIMRPEVQNTKNRDCLLIWAL